MVRAGEKPSWEKDKWKVDGAKECYSKCEHAEKMKAHDIILTADMWDVVQAMLLKFPTREWQMLFTGRKATDGIICEGYIIPKQETSAAYVSHKDNITAEMIKAQSIVCGIHSHVNMGVTPSHTDIEDSVMSLIDYHIIVNNKHDTNGMRKVMLPCGGLSVMKCEVLVAGLKDLSKLEIVGLDNIKERTYPPYVYNEDGEKRPGLVSRLFNDTPVKTEVKSDDTLRWKDYSIMEEEQWAEHLMKGAY